MKILKLMGKFILSLVLNFVLFTLLFFAFLIPFERFKLISAIVCCLVSFSLSFVFALTISIIKLINERKIAETKLGIWYQKHKASFTLMCMLLFFFSTSISSEVAFTKEKLVNFVSIQWAMFAITVTMFIIWTGIISRFLKDREPRIDKKSTLEQELLYKLEKKSFYAEIMQKTTSLFFVLINALVLIITTGIVFIFQEEVTVLSQTAVIFSFYVTGNALLQILIDMTIPFMETSVELQINNDIKADEINFSMFANAIKLYVKEEVKKIIEDKTLSTEEKEKQIDELKNNLEKAAKNLVKEGRNKSDQKLSRKKQEKLPIKRNKED